MKFELKLTITPECLAEASGKELETAVEEYLSELSKSLPRQMRRTAEPFLEETPICTPLHVACFDRIRNVEICDNSVAVSHKAVCSNCKPVQSNLREL